MIGKGSLGLLLVCLTAVPALAESQCDLNLGDGGPAQFCNGAYALCIKAPCKPIAGSTSTVSCSCIVEQGWSMGPAPCTDPGRNQASLPAGASVMSTYSNYFNTSEHTLTCKSKDTKWAWCYGAPCTVDKNDPTRATCTCPVCTGTANTLGGGCHEDACKEVYSAATVKNDFFANHHYYNYLQKQGVDVPPPATHCPLKPPPAH